MSQQFARNMLIEQRKRLVATLMQHVEREVFPHVDPAIQKALRGKVLSASAAYHDVCLDLLKAAVPDGTVGNDDALRQLASQVSGLRRDLSKEE